MSTNRVVSILATLSLASTILAQGTVVSPPRFTSIEGQSSASSFGSYSGGRQMFFEGELRNRALTIKGLAYRLDYRDFGTVRSLASGRSWSTVKIELAKCDMSNLSSTFSRNPTSTPVRVFSGSVSWPTATGSPATEPAAFDRRFPFASSFVYTGQSDLCIDYVFTGGIMANNKPWKSDHSITYLLDGYGEFERNDSSPLGKTGTAGCMDRGNRSGKSAYVSSSCTYTGPDSRANRNTVRYHFFGLEFGVRAVGVAALGFRALPTGVAFPGIRCNRVHVDFSLPTLPFPFLTDSGGQINSRFVPNFHGAPAKPSYVGAVLVNQALWNDSKTGHPKLSAAAVVTVPRVPVRYRRSMTQNWNGAATSGSTVHFRGTYNPICQFVN